MQRAHHTTGLYLFYDLTAKTYRNVNWIWSWGPAVKLLLECAKLDTADLAYSCDDLIARADEIGMPSTRFQIENLYTGSDRHVRGRIVGINNFSGSVIDAVSL